MLNLIIPPDSERLTTWIKCLRNIVSTWAWRFFNLLPLIPFTFNFFTRGNWFSYTGHVFNLRCKCFKSSSCIISPRTRAFIGWLRILNAWAKVNNTFVFLTNRYVLCIFSKSRFVSKILTRTTSWIIDNSLLLTVLNKC